MINKIKHSKRVILLEPNYRRKYIPLGLAKIATMVKNNEGEVFYQRKYTPVDEDAVCITSLFTYDSEIVDDTISEVQFLNPKANIYLGGVYASLMHKRISKLFPTITIFNGYSKELDSCVPDYSIDWQIKDPWDKFSFVFTSRGCPNRCAYCAVWKIEPDLWVNKNWHKHICLDKPYVMISDNNLSSMPLNHFKSIHKFITEKKKRIVFDNGFDCKLVTKELAQMLGQMKFTRSGMRLAFDRIEEDGQFQKAINMIKDGGVAKSHIMAYVLFNFNDKPKDADYRMRECVKLGIRPYPQQYTPLNRLNRDVPYIGKYWTKNLVRIFRFFWLMAGFNTKMTFEEYCVTRCTNSNNKMQMTKEDWKAWETS